MNYEINVSRNGQHFFATADRSLRNKMQVATVYQALVAAFPKPEYEITVMERLMTGREIKVDEKFVQEALGL